MEMKLIHKEQKLKKEKKKEVKANQEVKDDNYAVSQKQMNISKANDGKSKTIRIKCLEEATKEFKQGKSTVKYFLSVLAKEIIRLARFSEMDYDRYLSSTGINRKAEK